MRDWDIHHVLNKVTTPHRQAPARRSCACLAHLLKQDWWCLNTRAGGSRTKECVGEHASCFWQGCPSICQESSPQRHSAWRGTAFRHLQHPAAHTSMSCPWGKAACFVGFGTASCHLMRGTCWAQWVPNTWDHGSNVTLRRKRRRRAAATWQRLHSTQLPCVQDGGWVPAAKRESKWKTMTYWKLCEACLVSEDYRWAGDTNTGNRCSIDWKLFWQKAIAGDLVQRQIDAKCILKPQIRLILRRATYSLFGIAAGLRTGHTSVHLAESSEVHP